MYCLLDNEIQKYIVNSGNLLVISHSQDKENKWYLVIGSINFAGAVILPFPPFTQQLITEAVYGSVIGFIVQSGECTTHNGM